MWEKIREGRSDLHIGRESHRLRVHGGWIVRTITQDGFTVQTFVSDPEHKWVLPTPAQIRTGNY